MPWLPVTSTGGGGGESPRVGSTIAAINAMGAPTDGEPARLRVGTWPNLHEVELTYNATAGLWVSPEEVVVIQADAWAMDLANRTPTQLVDWSLIENAVPFGKANCQLTSAANLASSAFDEATATGSLAVTDTTDPGDHSFPFSDAGGWSLDPESGPFLRIADCYVSFTGRTTNSFTGCSVVEALGTRATYAVGTVVTQGYPGGWHLVSTPLAEVDTLYAAGLRLQERLSSLMNNSPANASISMPEKTLTIAPWWFDYDVGDGSIYPWPPSQIEIVGGLGTSAELDSLADTGGSIGEETDFFLTPNDWTDFPFTPTKAFLIPRIAGKMASGAIYSGSILDTLLKVRWVADD